MNLHEMTREELIAYATALRQQFFDQDKTAGIRAQLNQTLLDAFPCVALLLRPHTREIVAANAAAVKVGAVPGARCFSTWGQRDSPCPWCLAPEVWAAGEARRLEIEALGTVWDAHWIPIGPDLYMHYAFDITERRQAEKEIKESEGRYRSLFENMREGFAYCRMLFEDGKPADFVYLGVNDTFEQLTGLRNVIGKKVTEVIPGIRESNPEIFDIYGRVAQTGKSEKFEGYIESLGLWLSVSVYSTQEDHFVAVFDNINERKRAEEVIYQAKRDWEDAFDSITDMITLHDKDFNIVRYNKAAAQWLRLSNSAPPEQLKCYRYYHGSSAPPEACPSCLCLLTGEQAVFETFEPHLDKFIEIRAIPRFDSSNNLMGLIHVVRDISERKRAEEERAKLELQLVQAQKMEAVGTLAGGIAHDFNNLLQVVLGYSELLLAEKDAADPDYGDLQKILQAGQSGAELVQRLLMFSRKVEPKFIPINLNRQIMLVAKLLRRTIPKMIDIQMDLSRDIRDINADRSQIEQVVVNLAVNARDAIPDGGKIVIGTKNITLDEEYCNSHVGPGPGEYVLLTVSDTGHGMDKATMEHIFEPFFTTKELGRGTGLGLAMVYGITQQHGGFVRCYSEVGLGATFSVYFPAIEAETGAEIPRDEETPAGGVETILLVDDEDFVREFGARILTRVGYTVLSASNGNEALDLVKSNGKEISLVILDLIMPGMGGKDCLKELVGIDPDLPVLIASGYSVDLEMRETLDANAKGFVGKPFGVKELLRQVRKVLDQK